MKPNIVQGSFAAVCVARDMNKFLITFAVAKEYFDNTPSVLRSRCIWRLRFQLLCVSENCLKSLLLLVFTSLPVGSLAISVLHTKGTVCLIYVVILTSTGGGQSSSDRVPTCLTYPPVLVFLVTAPCSHSTLAAKSIGS